MTCRYGYKPATEDLVLEVGLERNCSRTFIVLSRRLVSSFNLLIMMLLSGPLLSFSLLKQLLMML